MGSKCCKGGDAKSGFHASDLKAAIDGKLKICVWMLGGPGSGKGTQCEMLAKHFKLAILSTGELLREFAKKETPRAKEISDVMQKGGLVDTGFVLQLLVGAMEEAYYNCDGYLIDGYPREVEQGVLFCENIGTPHVIIYLDAPDNVLTERLLGRRRADDNEDTIKARLTTFHNISEPVIEKWRSKVVTVNACRPPEEVNIDCVNAIQNCQK